MGPATVGLHGSLTVENDGSAQESDMTRRSSKPDRHGPVPLSAPPREPLSSWTIVLSYPLALERIRPNQRQRSWARGTAHTY